MKTLLIMILAVSATLLSQVNIGLEATILPHVENDFDFNPDVQQKILIGKKYFNVFIAYVPKNQKISDKKVVELLNTMIYYKRYSLTQTYFSDRVNFGIQINPTNWFGMYLGTTNGGKIELSDKYEKLYNITEETDVQFGFIFTPEITENLYIGLGTGWNGITDCSQISIQMVLKIK